MLTLDRKKLPKYIEHPQEGRLELKIEYTNSIWSMGYISDDCFYLVFIQRYKFDEGKEILYSFLEQNNYLDKNPFDSVRLSWLVLVLFLILFLILLS